MQKLTDDLIERFLSGNCTKEEAAMVSAYLKDHPDEEYLLHEFEQADSQTPLPPGYREDMLAFIIEKTGIGNEVAVPAEAPVIAAADQVPARIGSWGKRLRPLWYGAAAAVVIVLFKFWFFAGPAMKASGEQLAVTRVPAAAWIERYNNGKKEIGLTLPDSSKVRLLPGGRLRYRKDLGSQAQRDVQVTGKVVFDVAKNERAPFTVYSDGLRTRVLGTTFEVNANPFSDKIKIKLFTGKVLVSVEGEKKADKRGDYFLSPGQELIFSKRTGYVAINDALKHADAPVAKAGHAVQSDTISNWYMFNNQTLADVFDQLSAIYNVDIEYSRAEIRNMYFIGKLERRDSLNEIIQDIALLNHLSVTSLNGKYIIRKGKP